MTTPVIPNLPADSLILSAEDWLKFDLRAEESEVLIGTPDVPIIRPLTKNLVEAPDKSYKTTFLMRLALGLSTGTSVFSSLVVKRPRRVLYLHGELAPAELKQRLQEAARELPRPLGHFFQGRSLSAGLVTSQGQGVIRDLAEAFKPEVLVIDPWQSFIAGADENSFKEVSGAIAFMDKLIADCRLTILIAIHLGKNPKRGARGHSVLAGWRDTRFSLTRSGNSLSVAVEPRWAKPPAPLKLTFKEGTLWEVNGPNWTKQEDFIRGLVAANGGQVTRAAVGLALELDGSALRMALKRAHDHNAIVLDGETVQLPSTSSHTTSPNHPYRVVGL